MHAVQTAKSASRVRPPDSPVQHQISPVRSAARRIQRQTACACGGNCPRCQGEVHGHPNLTIGEAGDSHEREADAVAEQVMRMLDPQVHSSPTRPIAQRRCAECEEKETLLTKRAASTTRSPAAGAPPIVHDVLRSPGQPLDTATRAFMEPRFGHDFSGVRVHTDARAAESARSVDALAYTVGCNVVFGSGQFAPDEAVRTASLGARIDSCCTATGHGTSPPGPAARTRDQADGTIRTHVPILPPGTFEQRAATSFWLRRVSGAFNVPACRSRPVQRRRGAGCGSGRVVDGSPEPAGLVALDADEICPDPRCHALDQAAPRTSLIGSCSIPNRLGRRRALSTSISRRKIRRASSWARLSRPPTTTLTPPAGVETSAGP